MKLRPILLILTSALLLSGCGSSKPSISEIDSNSDASIISEEEESNTNTSTETPPVISESEPESEPEPSEPKKITVKAHTLKDSNPPIDITAKGDVVSESTWESFRNAPSSKFNGNYNYTYQAYSGGVETIEAFTKNGYYIKSSSGRLYYERKSGNTFYNYISTKEGYLRQETTLNLQDKYTYRIQQEIYVHMFDFSNYEYDDFDGSYIYRTTSFGATVMFQGGYLTYLWYSVGSAFFKIEATFETTIDIPESYYYE